jgi:hypothetical protein
MCEAETDATPASAAAFELWATCEVFQFENDAEAVGRSSRWIRMLSDGVLDEPMLDSVAHELGIVFKVQFVENAGAVRADRGGS